MAPVTMGGDNLTINFHSGRLVESFEDKDAKLVIRNFEFIVIFPFRSCWD
jgi:hypothetical protein